jgi:hypothetical protein
MYELPEPCTSSRYTARAKRNTAWASSRVPFGPSRVPFGCPSNISFVELLMFLFGVFKYVRREFMQRPFAALNGTLGSYLRDAFQEGSADAVACLPVPRA